MVWFDFAKVKVLSEEIPCMVLKHPSMARDGFWGSSFVYNSQKIFAAYGQRISSVQSSGSK